MTDADRTSVRIKRKCAATRILLSALLFLGGIVAGSSPAAAQINCDIVGDGWTWNYDQNSEIPSEFFWFFPLNPGEQLVVSVSLTMFADPINVELTVGDSRTTYTFFSPGAFSRVTTAPVGGGNVSLGWSFRPPLGEFEMSIAVRCLPIQISTQGLQCEAQGTFLGGWVLDGPFADARELRFLDTGELVTVVGCDGDWCEVRFGLLDRRGWIPRGLVDLPTGYTPCQLPPVDGYEEMQDAGDIPPDEDGTPPAPSSPSGGSSTGGPPIGISEAPSGGPIASSSASGPVIN